MNVQTFRDALATRPFQPFRIVMSSGVSYEIRHPEMAWLTKTSIVVGTGEMDQGVPADHRTCSLLHVTAIEPITAANSTR